MEFKEYYLKTYASWLGKIIGIRLGAPIEGWEYEEIVKTYGEIKYYPVDYDVFAADDDSNGPLFFVKALNDNSDDDLLTKMSNVVLNYVMDGQGFFWWGGEGISTEHTAYNNLKKGMIAPVSGSHKINGVELSTQIGGQIFSDCWGYISMGDPFLASDYAKKMASVTHDLDGIEGASFVASAISIAYNETDIKVVIDKALEFVSEESNYYKIVKEIKEFYYNNPDDYTKCLNYIIKNHHYGVYGGICPIISNTALMVMSMYYGESDFDKTMCILATAGWDTDCNLGNVGSIMGALVGIEGIDEKWIKPINDLLLSSSSIGSLNIDTVSNTALEFCKIGYKLKGLDILERYKKDKRFLFDLPYSTQSFRTNSYRYAETNLINSNGKLKVLINNGYEGYHTNVYQKTYYSPSDVYDARYDPIFSPTVYPNETIQFKVCNNEKLDLSFYIYVKDYENEYISEEYFVNDSIKTITYKIPKDIKIICEYGLKIKYNTRIMRSFIEIYEVEIVKGYDYVLDFKDLFYEDWGLNFIGESRKNINQLVNVYGNSFLNDNCLNLEEAMVIFSDYKSVVSKLEILFEYNDDLNMEYCFQVKGNNIYKSIMIDKNRVYFVDRVNSVKKELIGEINNKILETSLNLRLNIDVKYGNIEVLHGDVNCFKHSFDFKSDYGCVAIKNNSKNILKVYKCMLKAESGGKK